MVIHLVTVLKVLLPVCKVTLDKPRQPSVSVTAPTTATWVRKDETRQQVIDLQPRHRKRTQLFTQLFTSCLLSLSLEARFSVSMKCDCLEPKGLGLCSLIFLLKGFVCLRSSVLGGVNHLGFLSGLLRRCRG